MKKLLALLSIVTLGLQAQEAEHTQELSGFIVGTHLGMSYDVAHTSNDTDTHSSDMSTNGSYGYVSQYSLERKHSDKLQYGAKLNFGTVKGENDVEYHNNSFTEFSAMGRYTFLYRPEYVNVYASASAGVVGFRSARYFISDNGKTASIKDSSFKWDYALGIERHMTDNILCYVEACFNQVGHDGFDSWDYQDSDVDKYNFYALGFKFLLKKQRQLIAP